MSPRAPALRSAVLRVSRVQCGGGRHVAVSSMQRMKLVAMCAERAWPPTKKETLRNSGGTARWTVVYDSYPHAYLQLLGCGSGGDPSLRERSRFYRWTTPVGCRAEPAVHSLP